MGITDLLLLGCTWISSGVSVMSVSTGNVLGVSVTSVSTGNVLGVLGVSVLIPGIDFLVVELSEIEIVLESLEDCVGAVDTVGSLFSLISSCDLLFKPDFKGKFVLLVAFLEELLLSLKANVSEMLEKSI